MHIVLIGPSGSGKSSVAAGFAAGSEEMYEHISSGDIARHLAAADELAETALRRGEYAPEAAMRAEVAARIERATFDGKYIILDGFPRMLAQAVMLEQTLQDQPLYVELTCPLYICMQRIIKRKREHDKPDSIASRFEAYARDTEPMLRILRAGANFTPVENYVDPVENAIVTLKERVILI